MVSITLPPRMTEEVEAVISAGFYDNRSELVRVALRFFFDQKPEIRLGAAIKLYQSGNITISRAAEIAGVPYENMKMILIDEGLLKRGRVGRKKDTKQLEGLIN
jgi:Arc/MetJ-type ribon-helix-helix transcriptional regulator